MLISALHPTLDLQTSSPYSWALDVQSSAIVVFEKPTTRQKVLDAAQAKQLVQLKLQEPEHAYGLKGVLQPSTCHGNNPHKHAKLHIIQSHPHTCQES